ncbi:hypothetical protein LOTGIDRAFT_175371 [Lottia gigantea]|uniref:CCHC-type domain-containing protein n=1 Tax=Lottia gigantea TaxID=225164 RepID=V4AHJ7_LOTGI|nr:hypothetical protein LOTGIDRAFT_175371 [Lottia gigantea]ESO94675.1 hypothetical protein LOTGIDRAFT_175371 [Lottia gigantea]
MDQSVGSRNWKRSRLRALTRRITLFGKAAAYDSLPRTSSICEKDVLLILHGRLPICLKCYKAGHLRKECPLGKQPYYASAVNSSRISVNNHASVGTSALGGADASAGVGIGAGSRKGRLGFVQASTLIAKASRLSPADSPPLSSTHVRVDGDGFFTLKNIANKLTSTESNLILLSVENHSPQETISTKKFAFQPPTPPNKKMLTLNQLSWFLQRQEQVVFFQSHLGMQGNLTREANENIADVERINEELSNAGGITPGQCTDGDIAGSSDESSLEGDIT